MENFHDSRPDPFVKIWHFYEKSFHFQPVRKIIAFRKAFCLQEVLISHRFGSKIASLKDISLAF